MKMNVAKRIALFDYRVVPTNPIGGCHRRMIDGLCDEHEFTVFAVHFDNPRPDRIKWVRVPVPTRPLALLFISYRVVAPVVYLLHRVRWRRRFHLVQFVESNLSFGDVAYVQFCHRVFLRHFRRLLQASPLRRWLRLLDHWLHAVFEPRTYRRVRKVVVPSIGLQKELEAEYGVPRSKIELIPNPVDVHGLRRPPDFDPVQFRRRMGTSDDAVVLVFTALGHFERKGLPLILKALPQTPERAKLLVVGGDDDLVRSYQARARRSRIAERIVFAGLVRDVRPYLWASDGMIFPSLYEAFSLSVHEGAAAGLPIIATPVYGVEELVRDGENGYLVESSAESIAAAITRFVLIPPADREAMGKRAAMSVAEFTIQRFVSAWRGFYRRLESAEPPA